MATMTTGVATYQMFIGGEWVDAAAGGFFDSLNPYTGEAWARVPDGQQADVDRAVAAARKAMTTAPWKRMPPMQRGHWASRSIPLARVCAGKRRCQLPINLAIAGLSWPRSMWTRER